MGRSYVQAVVIGCAEIPHGETYDMHSPRANQRLKRAGCLRPAESGGVVSLWQPMRFGNAGEKKTMPGSDISLPLASEASGATSWLATTNDVKVLFVIGCGPGRAIADEACPHAFFDVPACAAEQFYWL